MLFNPTLMWTEYLNRLLGVTVGFLILATTVSAWRHHRREPRILWTTVAALLLTGFQGWLGGRVVAHDLAAWIVTVHMLVALVIVQLLLYATVRAVSAPSHLRTLAPSHLALSLIVLTMIQIGLGTQVRGAIDVAIDNGVARANALASAGWLDHLHRYVAFVVFAGAIGLVFWLRTNFSATAVVKWSLAVALLALFQIAFGIVLAYLFLSPVAQVLHLTVASLLLGAQTVLFLLIKGRPT